MIEAIAGEDVEDVAAATTWLSVRDVGVALGLHRNSVKRLPPTDLPYYRITDRGDRRYRRSDVEEYLRRRRVG